MSDRTPAGDKGTADRIEADDGAYWVRLVSKQALVREGEAMQNCLRWGNHSEAAGDEEMVSASVWSLRKVDGVSYLTVEVDIPYGSDERTKAQICQAEGPMKSQLAGWSVRQIRHMVAAFRGAGCEMEVDERFALTDADGMTWRPDKAPDAVRLPYEERRRREAEERERRHQEMLARHARWEEELRTRTVDLGERPFMRMARSRLARAILGVDTQFEWSLEPLTSNRIQVDEVSSGEVRALRRPRYDPGLDGITVTYDAPPLTMRMERAQVDVPAAPDPTLQQRLMTGFIVAGLVPDPRAREPPVPTRGLAFASEYAAVQALHGRIIGPGSGGRGHVEILGQTSVVLPSRGPPSRPGMYGHGGADRVNGWMTDLS